MDQTDFRALLGTPRHPSSGQASAGSSFNKRTFIPNSRSRHQNGSSAAAATFAKPRKAGHANQILQSSDGGEAARAARTKSSMPSGYRDRAKERVITDGDEELIKVAPKVKGLDFEALRRAKAGFDNDEGIERTEEEIEAQLDHLADNKVTASHKSTEHSKPVASKSDLLANLKRKRAADLEAPLTLAMKTGFKKVGEDSRGSKAVNGTKRHSPDEANGSSAYEISSRQARQQDNITMNPQRSTSTAKALKDPSPQTEGDIFDDVEGEYNPYADEQDDANAASDPLNPAASTIQNNTSSRTKTALSHKVFSTEDDETTRSTVTNTAPPIDSSLQIAESLKHASRLVEQREKAQAAESEKLSQAKQGSIAMGRFGAYEVEQNASALDYGSDDEED